MWTLASSLELAFLLSAAYVLGSFVWQIVYYRFFHPLAGFPGPFWGSVTRLWITYHNVMEDECKVFQALHQKYGTYGPCVGVHALQSHVDSNKFMKALSSG